MPSSYSFYSVELVTAVNLSASNPSIGTLVSPLVIRSATGLSHTGTNQNAFLARAGHKVRVVPSGGIADNGHPVRG